MDNDSIRVVCTADGPNKALRLEGGGEKGWPLQLLIRGGDCRRKSTTDRTLAFQSTLLMRATPQAYHTRQAKSKAFG